jgi:hypothetical protein
VNDFDAGLRKMADGIRRAHAAFDDADQGFIQALEGLKTITVARGGLDDRLRELQETISRLETMVLAQSEELRALRDGR